MTLMRKSRNRPVNQHIGNIVAIVIVTIRASFLLGLMALVTATNPTSRKNRYRVNLSR